MEKLVVVNSNHCVNVAAFSDSVRPFYEGMILSHVFFNLQNCIDIAIDLLQQFILQYKKMG